MKLVKSNRTKTITRAVGGFIKYRIEDQNKHFIFIEKTLGEFQARSFYNLLFTVEKIILDLRNSQNEKIRNDVFAMNATLNMAWESIHSAVFDADVARLKTVIYAYTTHFSREIKDIENYIANDMLCPGASVRWEMKENLLK